MRGYHCIILLVCLLASCDNNKKTGNKKVVAPAAMAGLTANEQLGIKEITNFYGGECKTATGKSRQGKRYFELQVSNSGSLDSNKAITELNASNIAMLFYKDLVEEKNDFDEIRATILFSDGQKVEKSYPIPKLDTVIGKMKIVVFIINALKTQKYDELDNLLNDKSGIVDYNKKELIEKIKIADPNIGRIKDFIPYGFVFFKSDKQKEILHVSGVMIRDKQNNEFSVDIDPTSPKDEAIFINYKL